MRWCAVSSRGCGGVWIMGIFVVVVVIVIVIVVMAVIMHIITGVLG